MPLGELTNNFDALRIPVKEADRKRGPYPYYGASGVVDYIDAYIFDGEYLLIAEDGENLRTHKTPIAFIAKGKFWVNNHAHIVQGNDKANTRFLMYVIDYGGVAAYLTGSTMPKLTQGNLNRIPILTPPLAEQQAIAHILGTLDDKIELNHRMNETLEAMARALFKSWFVDFDPVRAKAEKRQPTGMDAETATLFPNSSYLSEFGQTPEGWRTGKLEDVLTVIETGSRPAVGVDAVALRTYLDDEPQGDDRSAGAPRRRVNLSEGVEGAEEISHALLGVAMSRIASGEDKEAALALGIALQLNPKNSPAMMLLTATYLLWGKGGEERGRTSALRNIPGLAEELFGR